MNSPPSRLRELLGRPTPATGLNRESTAEAFTFDPQDKLHQVETTLRQIPSEDMGDPAEFERALQVFMQHAETGVHQVDRTGDATGHNSRIAMEAVIRVDGSRPSLLIKKGTVDPEYPLVQTWKETLVKVLPGLQARIAAIGRIEPSTPGSNNFFGTGWVVKKDPDENSGLILTNLHVLEEMRKRLSNAVLSNGKGGFQFLGDSAFIDFAAESGSLDRKRFKIVEATPSGIDGPGYARLDAAVMKIAPVGSAGAALAVPDPIPVIPDIAGAQGELASFCVVGYPGPAPYSSGVHEGVDWVWVNSILFGGRFGVKRLAPGQSHKRLGDVAGDAHPWVFGHDATTLGGSSGSPVLSWLDDTKGGFGLHFAGANIDSNYAHALAQMQVELEKLGVPFGTT